MGLYNQEDPIREFRKYLNRAEKRGIVPGWWNDEKRRECEVVARDRAGESCIYYAVEKHDVQEKYGDSWMPMELRGLAERIYGRAVGVW